MPRNGKFLILFNKFFCVQVKVHWLGPIVKWYTLVYESTLWNPYIRGGTYVLRKNWFFFSPPSPPSPHSLSLETTPLEFVDRVGGGGSGSWGFGDDQKNMEVRDKNIFKNSMNYEFKIWTREKKIKPAFVT